MRRFVLTLAVVLSGLSGAAQAQIFYHHGPVFHRPHYRHFYHHRYYHRPHHFHHYGRFHHGPRY